MADIYFEYLTIGFCKEENSESNVSKIKLTNFVFMETLATENYKDWYELLTPEDKRAIDDGLMDIEAGRIVSHEEVMEEMRQYIQSKK